MYTSPQKPPIHIFLEPPLCVLLETSYYKLATVYSYNQPMKSLTRVCLHYQLLEVPMYARHKKALSKKVSYEICTDTQAMVDSFCRQCDKFACKNYVHMHSVMRAVFDGHKIVPIDQLHKNRS